MTDLGVLHHVPIDGLLVLTVDSRGLDQLVLELLDAVLSSVRRSAWRAHGASSNHHMLDSQAWLAYAR